MTITIGSPIDRPDETRVALTGRTIPLAERMHAAAWEVPSGEDLDADEELDPVKIIFDMMYNEFKEKLLYGDEEETGNVTLEIDF